MLRVWLIFLAIYGERSVIRFLNYSQSDALGIAFKCVRVVRQRIGQLNAWASSGHNPLELGDMECLSAFVGQREAVYSHRLEAVKAIVRKGASRASFYFQGENGSASTPRQQRALRWLRQPMLARSARPERVA